MDLQLLLQQKFKFSSFRGVQESVLNALLSGQSVLALMPTGSGKSLCYQLPVFWGKDLKSTVLVISPLIALMQDQVDKAKALGIQAAAIHSNMTNGERQKQLQRLAAGSVHLLFVTPERFRKPEFIEALRPCKIQLFVVDEAHCISSWGHDFRPDYSLLGEIRQNLGNPLTLALTATATPQVQQDILHQLRIPQGQILSSGFRRGNLALHVESLMGFDGKLRALVGLNHHLQASGSGPVLLYTSLIRTLYAFSDALRQLSIPHWMYHGDLEPGQRKYQQREFQNADGGLMLATPAFGLGIDKANIRGVIHAELPGSIESYYQEVGRAGRDNLPAQAHLLFDADDVAIQMEFIDWAYPSVTDVIFVYRWMSSHWSQLLSEGLAPLKAQLSFANKRDHRVESTLRILERLGSLVSAKNRVGYELVSPPDQQALELVLGADLKKAQQRNLLNIVNYAKAETGCRMQKILEHFHEASEPCGKCDLCANKLDQNE